MADNNTTDDQSPDPEAPSPQLSGTANLIKNVSGYLAIEAEYETPVASGLMRKSLQDVGVAKTAGDVQTWAEINQAILNSPVNIVKTHDEVKAKTDALVNQMIGAAGSPATELPPAGSNQLSVSQSVGASPTDHFTPHHSELPFNDFDDAYEDDELLDELEDEPELDSLSEIFGTEDEEDAEEQALDYVLKISERVD